MANWLTELIRLIPPLWLQLFEKRRQHCRATRFLSNVRRVPSELRFGIVISRSRVDESHRKRHAHGPGLPADRDFGSHVLSDKEETSRPRDTLWQDKNHVRKNWCRAVFPSAITRLSVIVCYLIIVSRHARIQDYVVTHCGYTEWSAQLSDVGKIPFYVLRIPRDTFFAELCAVSLFACGAQCRSRNASACRESSSERILEDRRSWQIVRSGRTPVPFLSTRASRIKAFVLAVT